MRKIDETKTINHSVLSETYDDIKKSVQSKWENTKAVDTQSREILYYELKMLSVVYERLEKLFLYETEDKDSNEDIA